MAKKHKVVEVEVYKDHHYYVSEYFNTRWKARLFVFILNQTENFKGRID